MLNHQPNSASLWDPLNALNLFPQVHPKVFTSSSLAAASTGRTAAMPQRISTGSFK